MVCSQCGCQQTAEAQFCVRCGGKLTAEAVQPQAFQQQAWAGQGAPPGMPYVPQEQRVRVSQNLQALGILWCVFGVYRLVRGIVAATVLGALAHEGMFGDAPSFVPHFLWALAPVIAVSSVMLALLSLLTGYGLLTRKPWGRTLGIVTGVLTLIRIPIGTALGIYTLWVLAPSASATEWQRLQQGQG